MDRNVIEIPMTEKTSKKLKSLAALLGKDVGNIHQELSDILEEYISNRIKFTLDEMDGVEPVELPPADEYDKAEKQLRSRPPAQDMAYAYPNLVDEISGHSISDDSDEGALSLEEQVEAELPAKAPVQKKTPKPASRPLAQVAQDDDFVIPDLDVPSADDDVEKFIDGIEAVAAPRSSPLKAESVTRKPVAPVQPGKPRVKISEANYHEEPDRDLF